MNITREHVVHAKRTAMNVLFWCPCPLGDDHGFDEVMSMKGKEELKSGKLGSVYLHEFYDERSMEVIKTMLQDEATYLLRVFFGIDSDLAASYLMKYKTTDVPNDRGEYTICCPEIT